MGVVLGVLRYIVVDDVRDPIDIQTPLVSNAIFLVIVLSLTCLYVSRKDF